MFSQAEEALAGGDSILIFPEGTRSRDGKLQPFKRGSLLLAQKARVNIVPVAISGSFHILPAKSIFYDIVPVKVKIGRPMPYKASLEEVHAIIQQML